MRPPILQWKVMLLLLAVVVTSVSLASAFGPGNKQVSGRTGSWTGYSPLGSVQPVGGKSFSVKKMMRAVCASLRAELPKAVPSAKPGLRAQVHQFCHTRR